MRKDGKFVGIDGTVPEGQGILMAHLNECHELLEMVRYRCDQPKFALADFVFASLSNEWTKVKTKMKIMKTKTTHSRAVATRKKIDASLFGILERLELSE